MSLLRSSFGCGQRASPAVYLLSKAAAAAAMGGDGLQPRRRRRGRETHYNFFAKKDGGGRKGGKCQRGPSSSAVVVTRLSYVERSSNVTPSGERTHGVKAGFGGGGRGKAPGADLASINNTLPLSVPLCEVAHYYAERRRKEGSPPSRSLLEERRDWNVPPSLG